MTIQFNELEKLFEDIKDVIDYFERSDYKNRRTILFLSNGDCIKFKITNEALAHLVGINTNYLVSTGLYKNKNSFELLKELVESPYRVYEKENSGLIKYDRLFSDYIFDKVKAVKENIKINAYETEFVCKYNPEIAYSQGKLGEKYDYIIVKKFKNIDGYGVLGLVKGNDDNYLPRSNQFYFDYENLKENFRDVFIFQPVALLTNIISTNTITDYKKSYPLNMEIKKSKLQIIEDRKKDFDFVSDVTSDYIYSLTEAKKHRNNTV